MCTRTVKVMSLLGATLAFVAAICFVIGIAARGSPSVNHPQAADSQNFTLEAASSNHCGWALYVKSTDQEDATGSRVDRLTGFFGTGRRLTVPCTHASIEIRSPSGTLVYLTDSTTNSVGFVDTCSAKQSQWTLLDDVWCQLDHFGHFSLYDNPSLQAKETGAYHIVSNLDLYAYDYCEELLVEADDATARAFSLSGLVLLCVSCAMGVAACRWGCGGRQQSLVAAATPTVVGQPEAEIIGVTGQPCS